MGDFLPWLKKKSSSASTSHGSSGQKASSNAKPQEKAQPSVAASSSKKPQDTTPQSSLKDNYKMEKRDMVHFQMDRGYGPGNEKTPLQRYEYGKRSGHNPPEKLETLVKNPEHSLGLWSGEK